MDAKQPVVEETVDNSGGVEETDAYMNDLIKEVEQEFEDEDLAALPDGASSDKADGESDVGDVQPDEAGEQEVVEPGEDEDSEGDRSVERLVAREVELRTKEEALKAREFHVKAIEDENTQLKQRVAELEQRIPEDFFDQLRVKPFETLEANGFDPEYVVKGVLAAKLVKQGKSVPEQLLRELKDAEYDYKFKAIEREKAQMAQQQKALAFVQKVEAEARQYIRAMSELKPEFSKDAPTVAKVAKSNPDKVYAEIMDEIGRDATARSRDPQATLISYAEAARRVEKRWTEYKGLFGTDPSKDASTTADDTQAREQQTGASTQVKKAVKPLLNSKPKTQEELEQEGLDAALAEYKRVETARRKGVAPLRK